jgi:hypothetical protein
VLLGQADAGRVLCLAFLGVPFPRDYTITHTNPGWTIKKVKRSRKKFCLTGREEKNLRFEFIQDLQ